MNRKKGSVVDLIFIAVILVVFAVSTLITFKIMDEINTKLQDNVQIQEIDTDSRARNAFLNIKEMYPGVIDNSFLFIMIMLCVGALVLSSLVRVHPIFFAFFLIILVIIIFLSAVLGNIYLEIANDPSFLSIANDLKFTSLLIKWMPRVIGVFGFIMSAIMYKSWQEGAQ